MIEEKLDPPELSTQQKLKIAVVVTTTGLVSGSLTGRAYDLGKYLTQCAEYLLRIH